jgi:hypothetical protein
VTTPELPRTYRDAFTLRPLERPVYAGLIEFFRLTGLWRHPARASGDLETMRFLDKVYWLYKTTYPILRAEKGSGLEQYFAAQPVSVRPELPEGFSAESEVSLSAVGDLMDHPFVPGSSDTLYADVADIVFDVDVSMANMECVPHAVQGPIPFTLRAGPPLHYEPGSLEVLQGYGSKRFTFFATACNHSLDHGEEGVASTIRTLRAAGIAFNGVNESEEDAERATVIERNGVRLGLVSHTFGLNAHLPPPDKPWIVNRSNLNARVGEVELDRIERQLRFCREQEVDATIIHLHWGYEHELYPRPEQVELAHHLAELGFDVIIGHHPHVVQPVEYHRTKRDPDRIVPIYYSLGNLVNPCSAPFLCLSQIARIALVKGTTRNAKRRTYVKEAGKHEVVQEALVDQRKLRLRPEPAA